MSDITIHIKDTEVLSMLSLLEQRGDNMQPVLFAVGQALEGHIGLGFRDQKSPDGIPWAALSPVTISRRTNGSDVPLNDTGALKNSINTHVTNSSVEVGTNLKQAAMMNYGGKKSQFKHLWGDIPARQFMPEEHLPDPWLTDVLDIINQHFAI